MKKFKKIIKNSSINSLKELENMRLIWRSIAEILIKLANKFLTTFEKILRTLKQTDFMKMWEKFWKHFGKTKNFCKNWKKTENF